ncbi:hypothetical protein GQ44DRAFT_759104 [Phaeosphaeriaceae sp. PMI808]|nr:hypothetical protein GQ44DRAFT_759104 [Phaeosphaeriaceae sp. PMI808]
MASLFPKPTDHPIARVGLRLRIVLASSSCKLQCQPVLLKLGIIELGAQSRRCLVIGVYGSRALTNIAFSGACSFAIPAAFAITLIALDSSVSLAIWAVFHVVDRGGSSEQESASRGCGREGKGGMIFEPAIKLELGWVK